MTHEESEPTFEVRLEHSLLHDSLDEVMDLLSESSGMGNNHMLKRAIDQFDEAESTDLVVISRLYCITDSKVVARCLYEFELRDAVRTSGILDKLFNETLGVDQDLNEVMEFLARLRENGEGGVGDRQPLVPHDPRDADSIALDIPHEEHVGFDDDPPVSVLDRPDDGEAA